MQVMEQTEHIAIRKELAGYGAVPLSMEGVMSKIKFGKLSSIRFVKMSIEPWSARIPFRTFESLGRQRYANWLRNGNYGGFQLRRDAEQSTELVEAALALQILTDARAPL